MLHQDNNPDASCTYEIHGKKDGEKEQCCILLRLKLQANKCFRAQHQRCASTVVYLADVDFFVR